MRWKVPIELFYLIFKKIILGILFYVENVIYYLFYFIRVYIFWLPIPKFAALTQYDKNMEISKKTRGRHWETFFTFSVEGFSINRESCRIKYLSETRRVTNECATSRRGKPQNLIGVPHWTESSARVVVGTLPFILLHTTVSSNFIDSSNKFYTTLL